MTARFPRPSAKNNERTTWPPLDDVLPGRAAAGGLLARACCCPAKAIVRAIMPPTAGRPHRTDLLLCGHHYRASRQALDAAGALVRELPGTPGDAAAWIRYQSQAAGASS